MTAFAVARRDGVGRDLIDEMALAAILSLVIAKALILSLVIALATSFGVVIASSAILVVVTAEVAILVAVIAASVICVLYPRSGRSGQSWEPRRSTPCRYSGTACCRSSGTLDGPRNFQP
jgi:hypothetical protein